MSGVEGALRAVEVEYRRAAERFAPFNSAHEGWAVIREELDELWDEVKRNDACRAKEEAVQVAAMALRFLIDVDCGCAPAAPLGVESP